jgi:DNA-binding MarR family transcriptional regulator
MSLNSSLKLLMNLAKIETVVARRFDRLSIHGLGFNDFLLLYLLHQAPGSRLRRIDLAEKTGLTASGVTRMLLPLEKTGLVTRETSPRDARVGYAVLTETGRQVFEDARETANAVARELLPADSIKNNPSVVDLFRLLGGNIT